MIFTYNINVPDLLLFFILFIFFIIRLLKRSRDKAWELIEDSITILPKFNYVKNKDTEKIQLLERLEQLEVENKALKKGFSAAKILFFAFIIMLIIKFTPKKKSKEINETEK